MIRLIALFACMSFSGLVPAQQWFSVKAQDRPVTVNANGVVRSIDALRFGPPPSQSWRITITKLAREGSRVKAGALVGTTEGSPEVGSVETETINPPA